MGTGVPLAALAVLAALDASAAVEEMTAVRAVHWMPNLHDEFCFFFSFQRYKSPTITVGHGELEAVDTRVPLAAVDAGVHWLQ